MFSQKPAIDGEVYFNRKSQYAMNLQLVCDDLKRIRFYMIGYPGSMFDSTVFDKSKLLRKPDDYFSDGEFLLADAHWEEEYQVDAIDEVDDMLHRLTISETANDKRVELQNFLLGWKFGSG